MRFPVILLSLLLLSACTALAVGGKGGGYEAGRDERSAGVVASDSAITAAIKAKYVADSIVSVFNISVRSYDGTVTLWGTVGSFAARDQAVALAKNTDGVIVVNNQITVEDQSK